MVISSLRDHFTKNYSFGGALLFVLNGRTTRGVRHQFNTPRESPFVALAYMQARCIWCKHQNSSLNRPVIGLAVFIGMCR